MAKLSWVTPAGTLANLLIGVSSSVKIIAADSTNYGETFTYKVIGGELPPGLTLGTDGIITGVPSYSDPENPYFTKLNYSFIVRAKTSQGSILDGNFTITITNTISNDFAWLTPGGDLGTVPNGTFYKFQIQAASSETVTVTYKIISGKLPDGMQFTPAGYLQGVPTFLSPLKVGQSQTYKFTIRATNNFGRIIDRTFNITVTNVYGPTIEPTTEYLGEFFDGSYYRQQLTVAELNPNAVIEWSVKDGALPNGLTLDQTGLISGFIRPLQLVGQFGPGGFDGDTVEESVITEKQEYDYGPYDFNQVNQSNAYSFTVQAYDGANYDLQRYVINIASRVSFTTDNDIVTVDTTYLTVDSENVYIPVILNTERTLPEGRQDSYYAFKFDGFDFSGNELTYFISNTAGTFDADKFDPLERNDLNNGLAGSFDLVTTSNSNLPGLLLDAKTGWLYGQVNPQSSSLQVYSFGVQVSKTVNDLVYTSAPVYFNLPILGDVNNVIDWITPSNLGSIDNGTVSELVIEAKNVLGKPLTYTLLDSAGVSANLPQGLSLLSTGYLSGRASFETFSVDDFATTFDGDVTTVDRSYKFTVIATTTDGSASSSREFALKLNVIDTEPYENLYLQAMPAFDQRQIYNSIISDKTIFPDELIYRANDPWFGVNKDIKMLFVAGLTPETIDTYEDAIVHNHWTKTYNFDGVKTAVVLDDVYQVKYEVVYVSIVDPGLNDLGKGPAPVIDLGNSITNPYIDQFGNTYDMLYPNSSENMLLQLENNIGYNDQSSLPPWMTSNQLDPNNPGKFQPPVGFTRAVVLAYTVPGASKLIAYRLNNAGINFNSIQFSVDRYRVDDFYTKNYSIAESLFTGSLETTFDALPTNNVGAVVSKVNYAVRIPFNQIDGRAVSYVKSQGGIDGIMTFKDGDTLVFAQQEGFLNPGPEQGWVRYTDAFIGDDTTTPLEEGYDGTGYDSYSVIPGYLQKVQGTDPVNERGGIWQISVVNNVVNLTMIKEIEINQRVQITNGRSYSSAILYYNPVLKVGETVPKYTVYQLSLNAVKIPTTFNAGTTKFFSNRDHYYEPGSQDKYLKFPQYGVFR